MVINPSTSSIHSHRVGVRIAEEAEGQQEDTPPFENIFIDNSWASCTQPYFVTTSFGNNRRASWDPRMFSELYSLDGSSSKLEDRAFDLTEDRSRSEPPSGYNPLSPPFRQSLTASGHPDWGTVPTPKRAEKQNRTRSRSNSTRFPRGPEMPSPSDQNTAQLQNLVPAQHYSQQCFRSQEVDLQGPGLPASQNHDGSATNNQSYDNEGNHSFLSSKGAEGAFQMQVDSTSMHFRVRAHGPSIGFPNDIPTLFPHERADLLYTEVSFQEWPLTL